MGFADSSWTMPSNPPAERIIIPHGVGSKLIGIRYDRLPCPSAELVSAAKAEVNDRLANFQGAASNEHGYGILGWGPQCAASSQHVRIPPTYT